MNDSSDRRKQERIEIPEARTYSKFEHQIAPKNMFTGPEKLIDLSKGGIGFETSRVVNTDDIMWVKIDIPHEEALILKGTVRWIAPMPKNRMSRVGLRFTLFGRGNQYNSLQSLEILEKIQKRFGPSGSMENPGSVNGN